MSRQSMRLIILVTSLALLLPAGALSAVSGSVPDAAPVYGSPQAGGPSSAGSRPAGLPAAVTAGYDHTCVVTAAGGVQCWGANGRGQLGDGTTAGHLTPMDVPGLAAGVAAVSAGYSFSCALTSAGSVQCWGRNDYGQLGDGSTTERRSPVDVVGLTSSVVAVTAGLEQTCAIVLADADGDAVTSGGSVRCWGANGRGQLGDGTGTGHTTPVEVSRLGSDGQRATAVTAGTDHTCALLAGGSVRCWGYNLYGQLGIDPCWVPVDVLGRAAWPIFPRPRAIFRAE